MTSVSVLRSLANAADPGPWTFETSGSQVDLLNPGFQIAVCSVEGDTPEERAQTEATFAFIAAVDPGTMLALLDEIAELRRCVSAYYADHGIEGDPPCPCDPCEKARAIFRSILALESPDA